MTFEACDIVQLIDVACREYVAKHKTPVINVSYDGDHKSCEVIIDVELPAKHTHGVARTSFVISSGQVREIPYEVCGQDTEATRAHTDT